MCIVLSYFIFYGRLSEINLDDDDDGTIGPRCGSIAMSRDRNKLSISLLSVRPLIPPLRFSARPSVRPSVCLSLCFYLSGADLQRENGNSWKA